MKRILITSALPYINGIKHLGNLIGSQLPADLFARYYRARGHDVLFICATDEHGTPAELAAADAQISVDVYCAEMHNVQHKLAQGFSLSFDYFGRSSSARNHALTQHFAGCLAAAGFIREKTEQQIYSVTDNRFLPDRYVTGVCPECGYERARGDQCENCTRPLNPADLISPKSTISGTEDLELRTTNHLYLCQSLLTSEIEAWLNTKTEWPVLTTSIARKWLYDGDGLKDRGITRDLSWGIPVKNGTKAWPGMENKVFYVWFDAPIEYIAATAEWADATGQSDAAWQRWWRTDAGAADVYYIQVMGKDNVPFHTLSFPATLLGSGEAWKMVDYIKSLNYLMYEGGQFSTSDKRGIFMDQALAILPPDYWRWWLLSHAPESNDSEFTWHSFQSSINKDLADVLGNFVSRVMRFAKAHFSECVPAGGDYGALEKQCLAALDSRLKAYEAAMDAMEIRKSAFELRAMWAIGNEYIQAAAPWKTIRDTPLRAAATVRFALHVIRLYAILSAPFIPNTAKKMAHALDIDITHWPQSDLQAETHVLPIHQPVYTPESLFKKITDDDCQKWHNKFQGQTP